MAQQGFSVLDAASVAQWAACSLDELNALSADWNDMPHDQHLKDGGRYRRRRHSSFVHENGTLAQVPHRAHWQSLDYNALHGGMQRWFEPIKPEVVTSTAWQAVLSAMAQTASALYDRPVRTWCIEAHQFRIDTTDGIGRPTPEGAHRDGVDWVAVSFVRTRDDLLLARHYLSRYGSKARLMAKIEKPSAVARFEEILEEADGIMVARGDLGVEMPLEEVPIVQKRLILRCIAAGKPVITATQMLESMVQNPSPTRAEASDVANAIFDGTDAVMLSAETAAGAYPVEAVAMMARIAKAVESSPEFLQKLNVLRPAPTPTTQDAIAQAADDVVEAVGARAIVVFTATGGSARRIARTRPQVPILALTPNPEVRNQLALVWGVYPHLAPDPQDTDDMVRIALREVKALGLAQVGDRVVIAAGVPFGVRGTTNLIRVERVG